MTQLAALNVKITGDSSDLQSDLTKAEAGVKKVGAAATVAQTKTTGFTGGLGRLGNVSGRTRAQIQNTSYQLQDIAVQLSAGTRASVVFGQQIPQLLGGFGALGAVLGVVAGVGIPALAFAFSGLTEDTDELDDAVERVRENIAKLQTEVRGLSLGISEDELALVDAIAAKQRDIISLREKAKQQEEAIAAAVEKIADGQTRVAGGAVIANSNAFDSLKAAEEELAALQSELQVLKGLTSQRDTLLNTVKQTSDQERLLGNQMVVTSAQLKESEAIAKLLRDGISASAIEALLLADVDIVSGVDAASLAAATLAANLKISLEEALKLKSLAADPLDPFGGPGEFVPEDSPSWSDQAPPTSVFGGGGGAQTNPLEAEIERLRDSLLTKEALQIESYARQQEALAEALSAELIQKAEHDEMLEAAAFNHANAMAAIKQQETAMVTEAQRSMYSELGNLMGMFASKSKAAAIAQIAINKALSIASIIQNTAAAQVRALAELGPVAGPPAAAKIGMFGKVQAGLVAATGFMQAAGVAGGGGAVGGGDVGAGGGGAGGAAQAAPQTSSNVAISLTGGDMFSRSQVIELINSINDAVDDGARIRLV